MGGLEGTIWRVALFLDSRQRREKEKTAEGTYFTLFQQSIKDIRASRARMSGGQACAKDPVSEAECPRPY